LGAEAAARETDDVAVSDQADSADSAGYPDTALARLAVPPPLEGAGERVGEPIRIDERTGPRRLPAAGFLHPPYLLDAEAGYGILPRHRAMRAEIRGLHDEHDSGPESPATVHARACG
jgi:hypothetical protein